MSNGPSAYLSVAEIVKNAAVSGMDAYKALCAEAEADYEGFWAAGPRVHHLEKPFTQGARRVQCAVLQVVCRRQAERFYNCLDRNVEAGLGDKVALIFEADDGEVTKVTYKELLAKVCQFANAAARQGVRRATASSSICR